MVVAPLPPAAAAVAAVAGASGAGELFQLLRDGTPRTKAELVAMTSLARSTVTARVDALLAGGLVAPVGEAASTGGRPPTRFALDREARVVVAVDLGASHVTIALTDLAGRVLAETTEPSEIADGPEVVFERVTGLVKDLLRREGRRQDAVVGVGIGVPGPVEHATGRPANPPIMPGWHDADIPAIVRRSFPVAVLVDNDVNVMALGEHKAAWSDAEHFLYVKVATGIGAGIISNHRLTRGAVGTAGDLGHVRADGGDDVVCSCGNVGCLEAVAAAPAIAAHLREKGLATEGSADVVAAVVRGDVAAIQEVREAGRRIGGVLATCVSLLNPSVVVLGGAMSAAGEHLLAGVREIVYQRSLPLATTALRIVPSQTGERAGVLGAAAMVLDSVLAPSAVDELLASA